MRTLLRLAILGFLLFTAGAIVLAEGALHIWDKDPPVAAAADALGAAWKDVKVTAADGVVLDGWLFTPPHPNGAAVIALHGVADSRRGMLSHASFLLHAGTPS